MTPIGPRAVSVGAGVLTAGSGSASVEGIVVGPCSAGFYVQVDGILFAVLSDGNHAGPIHVVLDATAPTPAERSRVRIERDRIVTEAGSIETADASLYDPAMVPREQVARMAEVVASRSWSTAVPSDLEAVWDDVLDRVGADDLAGAALLLAGRGSGSTPTGDDVLAGLLLVDVLLGGDPGRAWGLAATVPTTRLSRCFLHWAARGQSIEPVHRLLACAGRADIAGVDDVASVVAAVGASSGMALLAGIGTGCRLRTG